MSVRIACNFLLIMILGCTSNTLFAIEYARRKQDVQVVQVEPFDCTHVRVFLPSVKVHVGLKTTVAHLKAVILGPLRREPYCLKWLNANALSIGCVYFSSTKHARFRIRITDLWEKTEVSDIIQYYGDQTRGRTLECFEFTILVLPTRHVTFGGSQICS